MEINLIISKKMQYPPVFVQKECFSSSFLEKYRRENCTDVFKRRKTLSLRKKYDTCC